MTANSSLLDVLLPYLLSALSSFSPTLCYPLKRELQFMRLGFFLFDGEISRKTLTPSYLELTRVHADILPLSGQCDPLPRTVDFFFFFNSLLEIQISNF